MLRRYALLELDKAAAALRSGRVLAYPTEAVFGLGCDPHNREAFEHIFTLKGRPATQGVLLIAADFSQIERYIDLDAVPAAALARARESWPGPFTWIFPRTPEVPDWVAGSLPGIALRITDHPVAAALCRAFGGALVSTSANPHGEPAARNIDELDRYFDSTGAGLLDGVVDAAVGGATQPSTIRDALTGTIIRP